MMRGIYIKNPLDILVEKGEDGRGGLVIMDSEIVELVPKGAEPSQPYETVFNADQHVVLPGLINAHHHFYQTLTRACPAALNKELFDWLKSLYRIWARLKPEQIARSSRLALVELLLSGCTTASDHHYVFSAGLEKAIDLQIEQAAQLGLRVVLTRGSMSLGEKDGGLPPDEVVQDEKTILQDSERLIEQYHQKGPGAMVQIALAPCSPFSVSRGLMKDSADLARSYGVQLHTHLGETQAEHEFCERVMKQTPVDYLQDVGWMAGDVWLAHGIHFNEEEVRRLGAAGVGICHCPSSNMILASGICPTLDLEAAGAPVGLGVDGSASNDCSNLMQEVRQALLLQRLKYGSAAISHEDALRWATKGSARCLGRRDLGILAPGKQADLALFKLDEPRFSGAGDPMAALILCGAQKADFVMVAGQWLVEHGRIPGLDLPELMAEHKRLAAALID